MPSFDFEQNYQGLVVGIDEVGCGPWAGPVMAAACCFHTYDIDPVILALIKDSKQLNHKKRQQIFDCLIDNKQGYWSYTLGACTVQEIDHLNIRQATLLAMQRAYEQLNITAVRALVDGTGVPKLNTIVQTLIKGDQLSYSIAAASIIAKVTRDQYMIKLSNDYPHYGWQTNAGYGTKVHQLGLQQQGITPHHRISFKPIQHYQALISQ